MTAPTVRVLLVADTHLGFDLPFRPRVERRRRGPDFFANLDRALEPVLAGQVDLVVHGGDLFYRSKVPAALVEMAMAPLVRVADAGVPVYLVPGNHERSRIPLHLWAAHPNLHIFDRPRTFLLPTPGGTLALSGFPFARRVRDAFAGLVRQTRHDEAHADARLLCLHQTVEGAQVGPSNYTFRSGPDIIRGSDLRSLSQGERAGVRVFRSFSPGEHAPSEAQGPAEMSDSNSLSQGERAGVRVFRSLSQGEHAPSQARGPAAIGDPNSLSPGEHAPSEAWGTSGVRVPPFCAVLAGHIHRAQVLTHDLQGTPLGVPVVYPGSVERTSFAERDEQKAFAIVTIGLDGQDRNRLRDVSFVPLPARPMVSLTLEPQNGDCEPMLDLVAQRLRAIQPDAVVRIQIRGPHTATARQVLGTATLRELAPSTMNVSLAPELYRRPQG